MFQITSEMLAQTSQANINKAGSLPFWWRMCNCPKVQFYEVEFKLWGMQVVPTHKNCGDPLTDDQASKFNKELMKLWNME